jgi:hypothetical protein
MAIKVVIQAWLAALPLLLLEAVGVVVFLELLLVEQADQVEVDQTVVQAVQVLAGKVPTAAQVFLLAFQQLLVVVEAVLVLQGQPEQLQPVALAVPEMHQVLLVHL